MSPIARPQPHNNHYLMLLVTLLYGNTCSKVCFNVKENAMGVGWTIGGVKGWIDTRKGGDMEEVFHGACLVHLCKARVTVYKLKALILACGISQSTNFTSLLKSLVFVYMSKIMIPYPYHICWILLSILIYACKRTQHIRDKSHTQSTYLGWVNLAPTTILIK